MTNPRIKPCPKCQSADYIGVARYDSGSRRVECDNTGCNYIGPCEGSVRLAIKGHNDRVIVVPRMTSNPAPTF